MSSESSIVNVSIPKFIAKIKSWMNANFLKLRSLPLGVYTKFHLSFTPSTSLVEHIELADDVKHLRVTLDKHLSLSLEASS